MKYSGGISLLDEYIIESVKKRRNELGISQAALSVDMELNDKYIGAAEGHTVDTKYNLNHLNKIAEILNCSIADFLPKPYLEGNYIKKSKKKEKKNEKKENKSKKLPPKR